MIRLLFADDDPANLMTLSVLLEEEGFEVVAATSLSEARARLEAGPAFDLALLDHQLGDGTAADLLPLLRTHSPRAQVIVLSGRAAAELPGLGGVTYLTKGISFEEALSTIRSALG